MATSLKVDSSHIESLNPDHEPLLTGALALANLFSNCVEAFGLIFPSHKWEGEEQLLLSRLGIQQARLLIWGQVVGISSPPSNVTDRAVPRHPSLAYPDLTEPTFFGARHERLDDPETRVIVENALTAMVDRPTALSKDEMVTKFGLRPPKKPVSERQVTLDANRLEAFREKFELLKEVAESYAHISSRRPIIVRSKWVIVDPFRFTTFIETTQEKVDLLINLMGVKEAVDRGMRMDIRSFGWHLSNDRHRAALDAAKLRLIAASCRDEYPEYVKATEQALEQMEREAREAREEAALSSSTLIGQAATGRRHSVHNHHDHSKADKGKRPGLRNILRSFRKHRTPEDGTTAQEDQPPRSHSDAGPITDPLHPETDQGDGFGIEPQPTRSKSVGAVMEVGELQTLNEKLAKTGLQDGTAENRTV